LPKRLQGHVLSMLPNAAPSGVAPAHWIAFTRATKTLQRSAVRQVCQIWTIIDNALQTISLAKSNISLGNDCSATFTATPSCADSSWALWNATKDTSNAAEYFCCLQGQVGLQSGYCVDSASAATAGAPAILVSLSHPFLIPLPSPLNPMLTISAPARLWYRHCARRKQRIEHCLC
jgi:hypothetical protein